MSAVDHGDPAAPTAYTCECKTTSEAVTGFALLTYTIGTVVASCAVWGLSTGYHSILFASLASMVGGAVGYLGRQKSAACQAPCGTPV